MRELLSKSNLKASHKNPTFEIVQQMCHVNTNQVQAIYLAWIYLYIYIYCKAKVPQSATSFIIWDYVQGNWQVKLVER